MVGLRPFSWLEARLHSRIALQHLYNSFSHLTDSRLRLSYYYTIPSMHDVSGMDQDGAERSGGAFGTVVSVVCRYFCWEEAREAKRR